MKWVVITAILMATMLSEAEGGEYTSLISFAFVSAVEAPSGMPPSVSDVEPPAEQSIIVGDCDSEDCEPQTLYIRPRFRRRFR